MLETIRADEIDLDGKALAVRYKEDPGQPGLVVVNITAHLTQGDPDHIQKGELDLVVVRKCMTKEAMRTRVQAEAQQRAIRRVAWIEDS